jgi:glycosyltransferase involved in cell wall biosynthesis
LRIAVLGVKGMPYPGGIEKVMEEVCSRLVKRGYEVCIYVRKYYMKNNQSKEYRGIKLRTSWGIHSKHLDAITHSVTALTRILFSKSQIVYINSIGLSLLAFIPRLFGKRSIVQTHGLDWQREKWGKIAKLMLKLASFSAIYFPNKTMCVSLKEKKYFEDRFNKKCLFIPNGVNIEPYCEPSLIKQNFNLEAYSYILFMARLVPEKGCHYLIEAWSMIPKNIRNNKTCDDIIFTGFVTGITKQELHSNSYCFIQPSTIEGMSISILEALSYGRFVIASDIQENLDVLQGLGITFQKGNINDLAEKIIYALSNPELIIKEYDKAIEIVKKYYDWKSIVDHLEMELIELLN